MVCSSRRCQGLNTDIMVQQAEHHITNTRCSGLHGEIDSKGLRFFVFEILRDSNLLYFFQGEDRDGEWLTVFSVCCYIFWEDGSDEASSAYMFDIALAKYSLAWGLLIYGKNVNQIRKHHDSWIIQLSLKITSTFATCLKCRSEKTILQCERLMDQSHSFCKFETSQLKLNKGIVFYNWRMS